MDSSTITFSAAFLAGLLTFVSPCILPIVPGYLCFLGGVTLDRLEAGEDADPGTARRVLIAAIAFVLGFSTVFVAFGLTASALGSLLTRHMDILAKVAGVIIVLFGLHVMGVFRLGVLNLEKRLHLETAPDGPAGAYLLGLAFAFGWSPCVGPILATILMMAGGSDTMLQGATLLAVYAAGLGMPFLLAALAARPFLRFMARFRRRMRWVEIGAGALLILTGAAIFAGTLTQVSQWLLETLPFLAEPA